MHTLVLLACGTVLNVFQPAPPVSYFGAVSDSFGNAIDSSAQATVVFKAGTTIIAWHRFRCGRHAPSEG